MGSKNGISLTMFSIHGLLRAENMQLGYDADTGGQIKYVVELSRALAQRDEIRRVDLFTRLIQDRSVSEDYSQKIEQVTDKFRIVRIQCGGLKYRRKELLWPYLDEFVDKTIKFIQQERAIPDLVHGHYPDAGHVAAELAGFFGIPLVYTGHSLGRSKKKRLVDEGGDLREMNRALKIDHRIEVEENVLKSADLVITSTRQEIEGQYGRYRNRTLPKYAVIPPGIEIEKFYPYYHDDPGDLKEKEESLFARESVKKELGHFLQQPDKPVILALCRPDRRKNIQGLIKAYGEDLELQAIANLAVFAGIRKDISEKEESERDVLTQMLLLMDKYNLYGRMAIPKQHNFEHEVPELYRIVAEKGGVFVNPALTEPFGLTLLEALACGLPIVSTCNGGPQDIMENCKGGILVDPTDSKAMSSAIRKVLVNPDQWNQFSKSGILNVRKFYTWENHARTYVEKIKALYKGAQHSTTSFTRTGVPAIGRRLTDLDCFLITDIDNTLLGGDPEYLKALMTLLEQNKDRLGFGVATGRMFESAVEVLKAHGVMMPDIIVSCVGTQIRYGDSFYYDRGWETHISKNWKPDLMALRLEEIDFIRPQEKEKQTPFKLSYYMEPGKDRLTMVHHLLTRNRFKYNLIYSHDEYLDILPFRASKGKAIRYIGYKWEIALKNILVAGDSGNDAEMLKGVPPGIVVGNYSPELESLKSTRNIYFARGSYSRGVMEGINHYGFIEKARRIATDGNKE
ncbi:MAG: HAD-IIB family hydrolase [Desulfobacterium sp.]|jgi:sucrose-phosphate synthase|nr:HAD-IIB family hydrolase [Desulfobacterium sp.]